MSPKSPPKTPCFIVKKTDEIDNPQLLQVSLKQISGHPRVLFFQNAPLPLPGCGVLLLPSREELGGPCSGRPPALSCCRNVPWGSLFPQARAPRLPTPGPRSAQGRITNSLRPAESGSPTSAHLPPWRGRCERRVAVGARLHPGGGLVSAGASASLLPRPPL